MLALVAALALAATSVQLPLEERFTALSVSTTGQAWVTAAHGSAGGTWGIVDAGGQPQWHDVSSHAFLGLLAPRPDGGMWVVIDDRTVLRAEPDGTSTPIRI